MRCHPETRAYEIRRSVEGKTHRDIRRSGQTRTRPTPLPTNRDHSAVRRSCRRSLTNIGASNGLLRDYFRKGTDLSAHSPEHLLAELRP
jgi:hypothetical protein